MSRPLKKLNAQHEVFAVEYLKDLNATKAAIRAGYSAKTASRKGPDLANDPLVAELIHTLKTERVERTKVDADYVLKRLVEVDQMDAIDILNPDGSIKSIPDWPPIWRQMISGLDLSEIWEGSGDQRQMVGILKKIKWPDKTKNLELIGKHVDVQAFKDKVEHEGNLKDLVPTINVNLTDG